MTPNKPSFYPLQALTVSDEDLAEAGSSGVDFEIELIRNVLRRLRLHQANLATPPSLSQSLAVLRDSAFASLVLTQLLRTRQMLKNAGPTPAEKYEEVMAELREKIPLGDDDSTASYS